MRFTNSLWKRFRIPGNLHTGKHQLPKIISSKQRKEYVKKLTLEAENEMWLTRPWLKKDEERFLPHGTRFSAPNKNVFNEENESGELKEYESKKYSVEMPNDVRLEDHWNNLMKENKWDKEVEEERYRFQRENDIVINISLPDQWPKPKEKWNKWKRIQSIPSYGIKINKPNSEQ